jgi:DNA-binding transcriptional LysR family regulator
MFERRSDLIKFLAVADTGKILAAADRLSITQPALSRVIARLEDQFGGQLFERIPTGMRLTELGAMAADLAGRILQEMEIAESKIGDAVSGRSGRLRISASPVWMQAVLPGAIADFREACPGVELKLRTASVGEGIRRLEEGDTDLHCGGIDAREPLPPFLKRESPLKVTWGIVAHRDHPLHERAVALADLAECPWIDYEGAAPATLPNGDGRPPLARVLDDLYDRTSKRVRTIVTAGAVGLFLLATGPYLAWLPLPFLEAIPEPALKPLPVDLGQHRYRTGIVWRRSAESMASFRILREIVRNVSSRQAG